MNRPLLLSCRECTFRDALGVEVRETGYGLCNEFV